jgi:hygromycin-B 7''-O-kinase
VALPVAASEGAWRALLADDAALAAGVGAIAARHGLCGASVRRYDSGSLPVYALGEQHVLKLFPPHEAGHADVEARVLGFIAGRLPLATPTVIAADAQDGWPYVLMTQLRGRRLVDLWASMTIDERDRLADELGAGLAALHALDLAGLAPIEPRWDGFIAQQIGSAVERQRQRGLAPMWLEQIPAFLESWQPVGGARALLHTEVMREHLMVERAASGWRLSGLFDFEPAMVGDPHYEFASVGLFVACGDARMLRRILRAYGHADAAIDGALACRFMAHALLHRYSNLPWYLQRLPPQGETTLEHLAQRWWAWQ